MLKQIYKSSTCTTLHPLANNTNTSIPAKSPPSPVPSLAFTPASDEESIKGSPTLSRAAHDETRSERVTPASGTVTPNSGRTTPTSCKGGRLPTSKTDPLSSIGMYRRGSSVRKTLSSATSFLSIYLINNPSKLLKNSMILAAISAFLMALYGMLYATIKEDISRTTVVLTRGIAQLVLNLVISVLSGDKFRVTNKPKEHSDVIWLWVNFVLLVAFGGIRLCFIFAALQLSPISIVNTILNGNPVLVMILAHVMLKIADSDERMTPIKISAAVCLIFGIILNSNPIAAIEDAIMENNLETSMGICLAVLALIFSSLGQIYTKKVSKHFTKMQISACIGASITIMAGVSSMFDEYFATMKVMKMNHKFLSGISSTHNITMDAYDGLLDQYPLTDLSCLFANDTGLGVTLNLAFSNEMDYDEMTNLTLTNNNDTLRNNASVVANMILDKDTMDSMTMVDHMIQCEVSKPPYLPSNVNVWVTTLVIALFGLMQQYILIAAIKMGSTSRVSMMRSSSILFSFVLQSSNSTVPEWNQWLGAMIIFCAIFMNTMETYIKSKFKEWKKNSSYFKRKEGKSKESNDTPNEKPKFKNNLDVEAQGKI